MKSPSIDRLRTLVAFADAGSCRGAAERVHRSEGAVSIQLRQLEDELGGTLFVKQGKRLVLTELGHEVVIDARRLVALTQAMLSRVQQRGAPPTLRVGTPDDYLSLMPDVLAAIRCAFPKVQLNLTCRPSAELRPMLGEHLLDLALLSCETDTGEGVVLRRLPVVWTAAAGQRVERQDPLPLALFPDGCIMRKWALNTLRQRDRAYEIVYTSGNIHALQRIVGRGMAVAPFIGLELPEHCRVIEPAAGLPALPDVTLMACFPEHAHQPWRAAVVKGLREVYPL